MRTAGLQGISHRRKRGRTGRLPAVHDDLVKRVFVADVPDRLWAIDVTEHPTSTGKVYCCAVIDAYSRMVVDGRSPTITAPSSSSMPCRWRRGGVARSPELWSTATR
jgi:transposase InsO family protein